MQHIECKLAIKTRDNIVSSGYILKTDSTDIHGKKMPKEVARVVVEVAHDEMARLQFPNLNAGITLVGQAVGVPVAWHKHLIIDESERGQVMSISYYCLTYFILKFILF